MALRRPVRPRTGVPSRYNRPGVVPGARKPGPAPAAEGVSSPTPDPAGVAPGQPAEAAPRAPSLLKRRRPVRTGSRGSDGGIPPIFIRIGVIAIIVVIGGIAKMATAKPAGDERYFKEAAELSRRVERQIILSPGTVKRQVEALPISGVTDPKLREFHNSLLEVFSLADQNLGEQEFERRFTAISARLDKLIDELNRKYTH